MNPSQITGEISTRIVQIVFISQHEPDGQLVDNIVLGSGFLVNKEGYIITAGHLLDSGEDYINKSAAPIKKLCIVIHKSDAMGWASNVSINDLVNDFEVIDRDTENDLALIKLKGSHLISPFNGETLFGVNYYEGVGGSLDLSDIPISAKIALNKNISVSGYPGVQTNLETHSGRITSSNKINLNNAVLAEGNSESTSRNITDCYKTDIPYIPVLNGGQVYYVNQAMVIGMFVSVLRDESGGSKYTVIVPGDYIISLIDHNNVKWGH